MSLPFELTVFFQCGVLGSALNLEVCQARTVLTVCKWWVEAELLYLLVSFFFFKFIMCCCWVLVQIY